MSDWSDETLDPNEIYVADFAIKSPGRQTWLVFGVQTTLKSLHAACTAQHYKHLRPKKYRALAAISGKGVNPKHEGPLLDVADKVFNFETERDAMEEFITHELLRESA